MWEEEIRKEWNRMIEDWEKGRLYYKWLSYMKQYCKRGWRRDEKDKELITLIIALSRKGLTITGPLVAYFLNLDRRGATVRLFNLASYKILEPLTPSKMRCRGFKLTSSFIKHMYTKFK